LATIRNRVIVVASAINGMVTRTGTLRATIALRSLPARIAEIAAVIFGLLTMNPIAPTTTVRMIEAISHSPHFASLSETS
jgi:hypothetical protein